MGSGALGVQQQKEPQPTTTDYLGAEAPVAFSSQPALPVGTSGGAGGGTSTAPPTIAGSGVGAAPPADQMGAFGDLAGAALGDTITPGGDPGQASGGLGVATAGQGIPGLPGFSVGQDIFGVESPLDIGVNPLGVGLKSSDPRIQTAITLAGRAGLPMGANFLSLLNGIINSPVLSSVIGAMSMVGLPLTVINLIDTVARAFPNTMVSQQGRAAGMDLSELENMSPQEIAQLAFSTTNPAQMSWTDPSFQIARHEADTPQGVGASTSPTGQQGSIVAGPAGQPGSVTAGDTGGGTGSGGGGGGGGGGGVGGPGDTGEAP